MSVVTVNQEATSRAVRWQSLRLLLVQLLSEAQRPLTIPELINACEAEGVIFTTRASKLISDTLRWEMRKKRVVRISRGRYRFGTMPRSTVWWLGQKIAALRARLRSLCAADRAARSRPAGAMPALQSAAIGRVDEPGWPPPPG